MFGLFAKRDPLWEEYRQIAEKKAMFTPDITDIRQQLMCNVLIYDSHKRGMKDHINLGPTAVFGGLAYTESSDFTMHKHLLGKETFPFVMEITDDQKIGFSSLIGEPGQIMGEVWSIRPDALIKLDEWHLNGVRFDRKRVKVVIPSSDNHKSKLEFPVIEVWMYIGVQDYWKNYENDVEARKLFAKSPRLFIAKENNKNNEPLGAYFTFDYQLEAGSK